MARRLARDTRHGMVAGVAAGFARHFDLDPILVRLGFIFLCLLGGAGLALYLISWVLMPRDIDAAAGAAEERASSGIADGGRDPRAGMPPIDRLARDAAEAGERMAQKVVEAGGRMAQEAGQAGDRVVESMRASLPEGTGRGRMVGGLILIVLGVVFLADRFLPFHWWWLRDLWPMVLVLIGLAMILGARRGA